MNSLFNSSKTKFDFNKISSRPGSAVKKDKDEKKEKTSNWSRFNDILNDHFNIDSDSLSKEDKFLCKEFYDELCRMQNMKQLFPCYE